MKKKKQEERHETKIRGESRTMAELELLEYYKEMCERNIVLDFQGAISQDMVVGMAELLKNKFSQELGRANIVKKLFSIFIEMAQNIAIYSAERVYLDDRHRDVGAGIIMVTEKNKIYQITSGNLVKKDSIPKIIEHCRTINHMDKEKLKQFYKAQIKSSREKGKKGAGVGLIDMARKSGNPILYEVTPVDNINSFLVLSVKIQQGQEGINNG
ncbi:MAG: SiaB family protein kinase [Candidatus Aminicenantes bacterium]|nr:MAG: SiaB family protein kinase [Candidatus Aminicenantes bacterium]